MSENNVSRSESQPHQPSKNSENYADNVFKNQQENGDANSEHNASKPDSEWEQLVAEHSDEFHDLEQSRAAHRFERSASKKEKAKERHEQRAERKREKEQEQEQTRHLLDASQLESSAFTPGHDDFRSARRSTVLFTISAIVGFILVIVSLFAPIPGIIAGLGGLFLLVGGVGLFFALRGFKETRHDINDDGARL